MNSLILIVICGLSFVIGKEENVCTCDSKANPTNCYLKEEDTLMTREEFQTYKCLKVEAQVSNNNNSTSNVAEEVVTAAAKSFFEQHKIIIIAVIVILILIIFICCCC